MRACNWLGINAFYSPVELRIDVLELLNLERPTWQPVLSAHFKESRINILRLSICRDSSYCSGSSFAYIGGPKPSIAQTRNEAETHVSDCLSYG